MVGGVADGGIGSNPRRRRWRRCWPRRPVVTPANSATPSRSGVGPGGVAELPPAFLERLVHRVLVTCRAAGQWAGCRGLLVDVGGARIASSRSGRCPPLTGRDLRLPARAVGHGVGGGHRAPGRFRRLIDADRRRPGAASCGRQLRVLTAPQADGRRGGWRHAGRRQRSSPLRRRSACSGELTVEACPAATRLVQERVGRSSGSGHASGRAAAGGWDALAVAMGGVAEPSAAVQVEAVSNLRHRHAGGQQRRQLCGGRLSREWPSPCRCEPHARTLEVSLLVRLELRGSRLCMTVLRRTCVAGTVVSPASAWSLALDGPWGAVGGGRLGRLPRWLPRRPSCRRSAASRRRVLAVRTSSPAAFLVIRSSTCTR